MAKSCPKGQYYCNTHQECRPIPDGCKVDKDGILVKEDALKDLLKGAAQDVLGGAVKELQGTKSFKQFKGTAKKFERTGKIDFGKLKKIKNNVQGDLEKIGTSTANNALDKGNDIINQLRSQLNAEEKSKCECEGCDKEVCVECGENCHSVNEGVGEIVKKGVKRHKDAVLKKKIKDRKAVPYAALAAEHEPEGDQLDEGALADRLKAQIKDKKKRWDKEGEAAKKSAYKALDDVKASQAAMDKELGEEIQGGISMEPYTKDTKFNEVETFDVITPEPLRPSPKGVEFSDWKNDLQEMPVLAKVALGGVISGLVKGGIGAAISPQVAKMQLGAAALNAGAAAINKLPSQKQKKEKPTTTTTTTTYQQVPDSQTTTT